MLRTRLDNSPKRRRRTLRQRGFTLMESLVAMGIASLLGAALMVAVTSSLTTSQVLTERAVAQGIADQLLEEIALTRYCESAANPYQSPLGLESGEGPERISFDDLDDFDGYEQTPPVDRWGLELGTGDDAGGLRNVGMQLHDTYLRDWRVKVSVFYVSDTNPSVALGAGLTSNSKAVEVKIFIDRPTGVTPVTTLRRVFVNIR